MLRSNFPNRRKARRERALERLKKSLVLATPPVQEGRAPRDLKSYREHIQKEIAAVEKKIKEAA